MFKSAVHELKATNLTSRAFELAGSDQRRKALSLIEHIESFSSTIPELQILKASLALSYDLRAETLAVLKVADGLLERAAATYAPADLRYLRTHIACLAHAARGGSMNGFPAYDVGYDRIDLGHVSGYLLHYLPLKEPPDWPSDQNDSARARRTNLPHQGLN